MFRVMGLLVVLMVSLWGLDACSKNVTSSETVVEKTPDVSKPPPRRPIVTYSEQRAPCKDRDPNRRAFFGDLHVHTGFSFDAYSNHTQLSPADAYRFAMGGKVGVAPYDKEGKATRFAQLRRSLDFAAVTDHAEFLGEVKLCITPGSPSYETSTCEKYRKRNATSIISFGVLLANPNPKRMDDVCGKDGALCHSAAKDRWNETRDAAEKAYDRTSGCAFVALVGYEYTSTPNVSNLHRNVIFRNNKVPERPITFFEAPSPYQLWSDLKKECLDAGNGCDVMTFGHNSNLSNGRMFAVQYEGAKGKEMEMKAAMLRLRLEPVMELFQHLGSMECKNGLFGVNGAPDPFCNFENVIAAPFEDCKDQPGSLGMRRLGCVSRLNYMRYILQEGLKEDVRLGVNPYRIGVVATTDTHNGLAGHTTEDNYIGHSGVADATPALRLGDGKLSDENLVGNPGGLTGVWAVEKSRDAIFDALQRRETFATSGTRIKVRLFGGWGYDKDLCQNESKLVQQGYEKGVPMGGSLPQPASGEKRPQFLVWAQQDSGVSGKSGTPLQRIQIIKSWLASDGSTYEKVYDVVGDTNSKTSVDVATCTPKGTGHSTLCKVWEDPSFDPKQRAFYYARVLENPTCRWSTYECNAAAKKPAVCNDPKLVKVIQERAWTSSIWYQPSR